MSRSNFRCLHITSCMSNGGRPREDGSVKIRQPTRDESCKASIIMLMKVHCQGVKKFVKLPNDFTFQDFLTEVKSKFGFASSAALQVFDDTDTNVEEDIFQELIEANPHLCLTVKCLEELSAGLPEVNTPTRSSTPSTCTDTLSVSSADYDEADIAVNRQSPRACSRETLDAEKAKQTIQDALEKQSGGEEVLEEYQVTKTLKHSTRRQLVNIVVSHMTETYGRIPTRKQRETYALGIVSLFPSLRDPFSAKGYEHFYDPEKGTVSVLELLPLLLGEVLSHPAHAEQAEPSPEQACLSTIRISPH
ncbi:uncharacterized protein LOC122324817 [Puntigrus tetrazona]|uniref:uncharacterized protein LOC122324817 n=1 Tax=Puntigrus tetrazona TaxID=1606681 RepID=UPI001C8A8435|nr:uncharacterized protein LOC122324817 [Puntigrus tetrazona]